MLVADLARAMEAIAPSALAQSWDNTGLVIGDPREPLRGVLVTIDVTFEVIEEAVSLGCSALVAYHPPIFQPLRALGPADLALHLAQARLAVYSPHTALDVAQGGTNDALAAALELSEVRVLRQTTPSGQGLGRIGVLRAPVSIDALIVQDKAALGIDHVLVAGSGDRRVRTVAVGAGAGGSLLRDAAAAGAEALLCGELGHHDALEAVRLGLCALCTLHSNTERLALPTLAERLRAALGASVPVHQSRRDADPFRVV
jgi:dinuclear metal center YbgI/SA1388 family protein